MRILVVEDDPEMSRVLERGLGAEGYEVTAVASGMDAMIAVGKTEFEAAAVDVMLPGMSGFEFCRHVRSAGNTMPILLLTARDRVEDRVFGLDSGADDYLTKPFAFAELCARLRALLRRDPSSGRGRLAVGRLSLDSHEHRAAIDEEELPLSPREFSLLRLLAVHAGEVVTRGTILDEVWRGADQVGRNVIDQYVSYLRKKLGARAGLRIETVRGTGYRLEAEERSQEGAAS